MPLQLDDLAALDAPILQCSGSPMMLPVDSIDEDPEQPRREFDSNALQDLAATIRERGVRQPISVRPNLQVADRWLLNFGARRLRACKLANLHEIPAFIDTTADSYDQVIENEQREGLKPLELALFVQKRLAAGDAQSEIARRLGKSRQYVTLATGLIEAPDWLLDAYREGRCRGITELYELRRLHGEHPHSTEAWASDRPSITRDAISSFRAELSEAIPCAKPAKESARSKSLDPADLEAAIDSMPEPAHQGKPHRQSNCRIHVELDGRDYQLVVSVAPPQGGHVYVRPLNGGPRTLAPASSLKLLGFVGR